MLEDYIKESWSRLSRHALDVALDPKVSGESRTYLYIPPDEDPAAINRMIVERRALKDQPGAIEVKPLPADFLVAGNHGILYLPHAYIVPGGRFNEMYGWDSYWIILGLVQDGLPQLARGMVENFIYQIKNYGGKILNANRTYYLSRSQPPMLGQMALAVLPTLKPEQRRDFLQRVADATAQEYDSFWKAHRYDERWGLFHYGDIEQGALGLCPETTFGERDEHGLSHYDKIAAYLRALPATDILRQRFIDDATGELSPEAIAGDRAMRESGFDASMHMGYYGLQTMDFHPVCLNTLLYMQCQALEEMYNELGDGDRADYFRHEAAELHAHIHKYMWSEEAGLFLNFNHRDNKLSDFPYLTCVYPLWAGIATAQQAQHFRDRLSVFETPYGIKGTDRQTGCQWDGPFMWAPLVYATVAGLHRYGFTGEAQRIGRKFVDTVDRVNQATGANFEKYNADTGGIRTEGLIEVGYAENVVGFGWTNGAVLALKKWLQKAEAPAVAAPSKHSDFKLKPLV